MAETFQWQPYGKTWRGPGIYHVTMVAHKREPLFGTLTGNAGTAFDEKTDLGWALIHNMNKMLTICPEIKILADQLMPNHLHLVVQVTESMKRGIRGVLRGYMQGCKAEARKMGRDEPLFDDRPFIRPLAQKGQLEAMIAYTKANPQRAWLRQQHPDLFRLRRELAINTPSGTLVFSALGNRFLLDYPIEQALQCSRSLRIEQIEQQKKEMLQAVENGSVTITGAISEGEKQIARAIREAGWPMVVLLKDGFPAEGSPNERFFKPSGVYYEACAAGRLLLLEPTSDTFILPAVQKKTEEAIRHKAEENHYNYSSVPVDSQRYRFMAMNQMAQILAERFCDEREDGEKG